MENTTLVLKTADSSSSSLNSVNTWNNINLRNLMGNMYDKYEKFNLCLVNISTGASNPTLGTSTDDLNVSVNISGLPFINQTYNTSTGNNTNTATITTFQFQRNNCINQYFYGSNFLTFGKAQDLCNITISFSKVSNYLVGLSTSVSYPNVSYIFSIVGIPNDDDKLLTPQSRMDKNTGRIK
jgi:hypothetical protein